MTNEMNPRPVIPVALRNLVLEDASKHADLMQEVISDWGMDLLMQNYPDLDPESDETDRILCDVEGALIQIWIERFKNDF